MVVCVVSIIGTCQYTGRTKCRDLVLKLAVRTFVSATGLDTVKCI